MFGSQCKKIKVNAAANTIKESASDVSGEQKKYHSPIHSKKKKLQVQKEMI